MEPPRESALAPEEREALRRRLLAAAPPGYSPWLHLVFPSLFGLSVVAAAAWLVRGLGAWELLAVPVAYLLGNMAEWRIHKYMLHRPSSLAPVLYARHTPEHHLVYVTGDMSMRSRREWRLVLIPAYGIVLAFLAVLVPAAAVWLAGLRNPALLFLATAMAYVLTYEWLHLSYHLPADHFVARLALVRRLRRHHAVHHDPRLMQRWNFNVTVPLWDWLRGTIAREEPAGGGTDGSPA